jgi:hypothetical protein
MCTNELHICLDHTVTIKINHVCLWNLWPTFSLLEVQFEQCLNTEIFNPFQSNFSNNRILPSSYLFIPAIFLQAQPHEYNAQSPVHIKIHALLRNGKSTTCAICWPKSVLHKEKRRTGSDSGAGTTKTCRTSSDISAEQENHVGRGPT